MLWISKEPPIYVWRGDTWFNEKDKRVYTADLTKQVWYCDIDGICQVFPFTKKTKVMSYELT